MNGVALSINTRILVDIEWMCVCCCKPVYTVNVWWNARAFCRLYVTTDCPSPSYLSAVDARHTYACLAHAHTKRLHVVLWYMHTCASAHTSIRIKPQRQQHRSQICMFAGECVCVCVKMTTWYGQHYIQTQSAYRHHTKKNHF